MQEHHGDYRNAFYDLAGRFVAVVHGTSPGFLRWPPDEPAKEGKPIIQPVDDGSWIKTAAEA
jgi:ABC-type amino acid transport substrate-binding protein